MNKTFFFISNKPSFLIIISLILFVVENDQNVSLFSSDTTIDIPWWIWGVLCHSSMIVKKQSEESNRELVWLFVLKK